MYDAPFDALTRIGWSLAGLVVVLVVARAVLLERPGPPVLGRVVTVTTGLAVLALVAVLAVLVVTVLGG